MTLKNLKWKEAVANFKKNNKTCDTLEMITPLSGDAIAEGLKIRKFLLKTTPLLTYDLKGFRPLNQKEIQGKMFVYNATDTQAYIRILRGAFIYLQITSKSTPKGLIYISPMIAPDNYEPEDPYRGEVHIVLSHLADRLYERVVSKEDNPTKRNRKNLVFSVMHNLLKEGRTIYFNFTTGELITYLPGVALLGNAGGIVFGAKKDKHMINFVHNTIITEDMFTEEQRRISRGELLDKWVQYTPCFEKSYSQLAYGVTGTSEIMSYLIKKFGKDVLRLQMNH
jgi:hypothetical protein